MLTVGIGKQRKTSRAPRRRPRSHDGIARLPLRTPLPNYPACGRQKVFPTTPYDGLCRGREVPSPQTAE